MHHAKYLVLCSMRDRIHHTMGSIIYIAKDGGSILITGGDDIKIDINVQQNGTSTYQIIQIGTGKSDQPA